MICAVCGKTVYPLEAVAYNGARYHKPCFRCATCGRLLSPGSATAHGDRLYCAAHYKEVMMSGAGSDRVRRDPPAVASDGPAKEPTSEPAAETGVAKDPANEPAAETAAPQPTAPGVDIDALFREAATIQPLAVPASARAQVLEGRFGAGSVPATSRTLCFFLSSTFNDTQKERNYLAVHAFPILRRLAAAVSLQFEAVDMRFGVANEASASHDTTQICLDEIRRTRALSVGAHFVAFLGDRSGWRPCPATVDAVAFDKIVALLTEQGRDEVALLERWFVRNDNVIPAVYALQPIDVVLPDWPQSAAAAAEWDTSSVAMRDALQDGSTALGLGELASSSVTEIEVREGILSTPENRAFVIRRRFSKVDHEDPAAARFIDTKPLHTIDLRGHVSQDHDLDMDIEWARGGVDPDVPEHARHLERFSESLTGLLGRSILDAARTTCSKPDALYSEVLEHFLGVQQRVSSFSGMRAAVERGLAYLAEASPRAPLVFHGPSGSGKSSLVCKIAHEHAGLGQGGFTVIRLLGTSPQSSDARSMLRSLAEQVTDLYGAHARLAPVPSSYAELVADLPIRLALATAEKPLFVFLDSLDQLSDADNGRELGWMPWVLPDHVHLVLSTLPNVGPSFGVVQGKVAADALVAVEPLTTAEAMGILDLWMEQDSRRLTAEQRELVQRKVEACPLPLYLRLVYEQSRRWTSGMSASGLAVPDTVPGAVEAMFERLERRFGAVIVGHSLALLTAAQDGLSSAELENVLSCDDEALDALFAWHTPALRRLPPFFLARLRAEIGKYLMDRSADGHNVLAWHHRQFWEAAERRFLGSAEVKERFHGLLADFFSGASGRRFADRGVSDYADADAAPTLRQLRQLPYHLARAKRWDELAAFLVREPVAAFYTADARKFELMVFWRDIEAARAGGQPDRTAAYTQAVSDAGYPCGLVLAVCEFLRASALYDERLTALMEQGLGMAKASAPELVARATLALGNMHQEVAAFEKAQPLLEEAVGLLRTGGPERESELVSALQKLGTFHFYRGNIAQANEIYGEYIELARRVLDPDHPELGMAHNCRGETQRKLGNLDTAGEHHRQALAIRERSLGRHMFTGDSHNNVGQILRERGELDAALAKFEEATQMHSDVLGASHPRVGAGLAFQAQIKVMQEKLEEARDLFTRALPARERLGKNHPRVGDICSQLSSVLERLGQAQAAVPYLERAIQIARDSGQSIENFDVGALEARLEALRQAAAAQ